MIRSGNTSAATPRFGIHRNAWRRALRYLARPRLISNLLALVALFSIGFV